MHRTVGLLACGLLAIACADRAAGPTAQSGVISNATPPHAGSVVALPEEPWYRDKPDRTDDCVVALPAVPPSHFPPPFETCDPRAESYASPPSSSHLHFHYRFFSVALTEARRRKTPGTCCYMVWAFPR